MGNSASLWTTHYIIFFWTATLDFKLVQKYRSWFMSCTPLSSKVEIPVSMADFSLSLQTTIFQPWLLCSSCGAENFFQLLLECWLTHQFKFSGFLSKSSTVLLCCLVLLWYHPTFYITSLGEGQWWCQIKKTKKSVSFSDIRVCTKPITHIFSWQFCMF